MKKAFARVAEHGWETALNHAGTSFRKLVPAEHERLDAERAIPPVGPCPGRHEEALA